jgi:hypothetical protein
LPDEIIDSVVFLGKEKRKGKNTRKAEWINQKLEIAVLIDLSASVEMT